MNPTILDRVCSMCKRRGSIKKLLIGGNCSSTRALTPALLRKKRGQAGNRTCAIWRYLMQQRSFTNRSRSEGSLIRNPSRVCFQRLRWGYQKRFRQYDLEVHNIVIGRGILDITEYTDTDWERAVGTRKSTLRATSSPCKVMRTPGTWNVSRPLRCLWRNFVHSEGRKDGGFSKS